MTKSEHINNAEALIDYLDQEREKNKRLLAEDRDDGDMGISQ